MVGNGEIQLVGYFLLQALYALILKFHNLAAPNAYAVVMVAVIRDVLIPCLAVAKLPFKRKAAFGQKFHGSIDCCITNLGVFAPDPLKKLFQIYMGIGLEENIYDVVSLGGGLEALFVQILLEEFFLVRKFHRDLHLNFFVIPAALLSGNLVLFKQKPYPSPNVFIGDRSTRG